MSEPSTSLGVKGVLAAGAPARFPMIIGVGSEWTKSTDVSPGVRLVSGIL